jgi:long-subunit fatty acid transport protein
MQKLRISLALAALITAGFSLPRVHADGLVLDGVGPISGGRGGTNQAFSDNAAIILDNPAGMMNVAGDGLAEAGVDLVTPVVNYSDSFNDVQSKIRPLPLPNLGYIRKSANGQWAWGIGAFVPAGFGASYGQMLEPNTGSNLMRSQGGMAKLLPALSFRATERL